MQDFHFYTSLPLGDIIYALPGIRKVCHDKGTKAVIHLDVNQKWPMAEGIMRRNGITISDLDFEMIKPLLLSQDYISGVDRFTDQQAINLDEVMRYPTNVPYGHIPRWYFYVYPEMACNLAEPWLFVDGRIKLLNKGFILISRSARYHNPHISYRFLEKYKDRIFFIGLDDEWMSFCKVFFEVRHYKIQDFQELALLINSCKFFIGNQSFPFSIAEGLKVPRILELFDPLPNVIPHGDHAYDFYMQYGFEVYVEKLMKI